MGETFVLLRIEVLHEAAPAENARNTTASTLHQTDQTDDTS